MPYYFGGERSGGLIGIPVLIIGESGSGKSASLRNFQSGEIAIINVQGKPLPFRNHLKAKHTDSYPEIQRLLPALADKGAKSIVIDDCQYLMANEFMRRSAETGFQKFTDIGKNFWNLVQSSISLPDDIIIYFLGHVERDQNGNEKFKTIGKLLDDKITVEGMFTIVLRSQAVDGKYSFRTQTNGMDTAKSPMGLFDTLEIDNDLKFVDRQIRDYYAINKED